MLNSRRWEECLKFPAYQYKVTSANTKIVVVKSSFILASFKVGKLFWRLGTLISVRLWNFKDGGS